MINNAISADDFLPLFTYVLVNSVVPHLFLLKELMVALISNEDAYGECGKLFPFPYCFIFTFIIFCLIGYYLATMEAAIQHVSDMANQYEGIVVNDGFYEEREDSFDFGNATKS
jgi:hypothetical protein